MKLILNKNTLKKLETKEDEEQKSGSINDYEVEIEFDESWDNLSKTLIIVKSENNQIEDTGTKIAVLTNKVCIDREKRGQYWIGVVGYTLQFIQNQDEKIKEEEKYYIRTGTEENYNYVFVENPVQEDLPTYFKAIKNYQRSTNLVPKYFGLGAGEIKAENQKVPTPTEWEIYNAQIQEFIKQGQAVVDEANNLNVELEDNLLTITKKDGTQVTTNVKGDDYIITEEDKTEIKEEVEANIQPILENIENVANQAEVIARGKSDSVVKDTWAEMEQWLKDIANKGTHKAGDNLYIKAKYKDETMTERQPDYWIAEVLEEPNEKGYYYEISELEADKPDLEPYAKTEQFVVLTQAEYDVLSTNGTYTKEDGTVLTFSAKAFYYIIEEE